MAEPQYVPEPWDSLPVQPPAGRWAKRIAPLLVQILVTVGLAVVAVFISLVTRAALWVAWILFAVFLAQAAAVVVMCVLGARPYRAERKLGYTTWPSDKARPGQ